MNKRAVSFLAFLLLSTFSQTTGQVNKLKPIVAKPGKSFSKFNRILKVNPKRTSAPVLPKSSTKELAPETIVKGFGTYVDGLFIRNESMECGPVYAKLLQSSYDSKMIEHKRVEALIASFKSLPIPDFSIKFESDYGGPDKDPGLLQSKQTPTGETVLKDEILIKAETELSSLVLGPAQFFLAQALANAEAETANHENYLQICKLVQVYISCLRKLRVYEEQMRDFAIENEEAQARYKVGSFSNIEALQAKQRLDVATAKREEAVSEVESAQKNLKQVTPDLKEEDFKKLDQLSKINFNYTPIELETLNHSLVTPLSKQIRLRMRGVRMQEGIAMSRVVLPAVGAESKLSSLTGESNVRLSVTWTMGVKNASEIIKGIVESRRIAIDGAKQLKRIEEDLKAVARKYNRSLKVLELGIIKVNSCLARLKHHDAMDQADPGAHFDKRGKYKEDLYAMRKEAEDTLDKLALAYLEYMALSGLLCAQDRFITNEVVKYSNNKGKRELKSKVPTGRIRPKGNNRSQLLTRKPQSDVVRPMGLRLKSKDAPTGPLRKPKVLVTPAK